MSDRDVRLIIASENEIVMYEAPDGVKITAMTEHGGKLYVALHHEVGKNELITFDLENTRTPDKEALEALNRILDDCIYQGNYKTEDVSIVRKALSGGEG